MSEELEKKAAEKAEKPAKKKDKKPNFFVRAGKGIAKFSRETRSELKKVVWPTPQQTFKNTGVVVAVVLLVGLCVGVVDTGLGELLKLVLGA